MYIILYIVFTHIELNNSQKALNRRYKSSKFKVSGFLMGATSQ